MTAQASSPLASGSPPRDLLARTAELPGSKRELLAVLNEYRAALFAFAAESDRA
jgi:hypothetical protein